MGVLSRLPAEVEIAHFDAIDWPQEFALDATIVHTTSPIGMSRIEA
jgi:hypothetical protein